MLVLTRKPGEKLMIGDDIVITVLSVDGDKIKLGIDAPKNVEVYRKEILDAIVEENRLACEIVPQQISEFNHLVEEREKKKALKD